MAVRLCTDGGQCIECAGTAAEAVREIQKKVKEGYLWLCCGTECLRADKITSVKEVSRSTDEDDNGGGDRPVLGNPEVVIITSGQTLLRGRAPQPEAEPRWIGEEGESREMRFES